MLNKKFIAAMVLMSASAVSMADTAPTNRIDELTSINEEILVLKAKTSRAELHAKLIGNYEYDSKLTPDSITAANIDQSIIAPEKKDKGASGEEDPVSLLKVVSIEGYDGVMRALATYDGKSFFQIKKGDQITSKWVVHAIKFGSVLFKSKKGKVIHVTLGANNLGD